jgi:L-asparaginase II
MDAISVTARRGGVVEAVHRVHAIAVRDGEVIATAGNAELVCYLRSSAKPIQAQPLVRAYDKLDDAEIAIACASHRAEPAQIDAVHRLLDRALATEDDLECGEQDGRPRGQIHHNCSGKHAGMLAACRANGWPLAGYTSPKHPLQQAIARDIEEASGVSDHPTAVDGCGVPCFAMPLPAMARLLTRAVPRVAEAIRARPELVGGNGSADTELMRALPGWIAKGGAEGLLCGASPGGTGIALKVEDGNFRPLKPALHRFFLEALGVEIYGFDHVALRNSRGETVGELAIGGS